MAHVMSKPPECTRRCDGLHRSGVTPIRQYDVYMSHKALGVSKRERMTMSAMTTI